MFQIEEMPYRAMQLYILHVFSDKSKYNTIIYYSAPIKYMTE